MCPLLVYDAALSYKLNPAVVLLQLTVVPSIVANVDTYPVIATLPAPNLTNNWLDPFVLTPLNITVIRFTQLGIPVKSTAFPDAVCAVASVSEPP
jgi:hypothetical protein